MSASKHTPTPWCEPRPWVEPQGSTPRLDRHQRWVEMTNEDYEYARHCVNSHNAMLEALEEQLRICADLVVLASESLDGTALARLAGIVMPAGIRANAALTSARGEEK